MDMMIVKVLGVVFVSIVFVVTVLLMPRIFGVDSSSATEKRDDVRPPAPAPVVAPPVAMPEPSGRLVKS